MFAVAVRMTNKNYVGKKCGVIGLTRIGKCPICKARVERSHTDIFFPYCSYACKRVEQKREEEREKRKIDREQKRYEAKLLADKERSAKRKAKEVKKSELEMVRERLAKCQEEYNKHAKAFAELPKGDGRRHYECDRSNYWYRKMIFAQKAVDDVERRLGITNDCSSSTETDQKK